MPQDWFTENPKELVSSNILSDLENFWNGSASETSDAPQVK
jgi:hypothetical protein